MPQTAKSDRNDARTANVRTWMVFLGLVALPIITDRVCRYTVPLTDVVGEWEAAEPDVLSLRADGTLVSRSGSQAIGGWWRQERPGQLVLTANHQIPLYLEARRQYRWGVPHDVLAEDCGPLCTIEYHRVSSAQR